MRIALRSLLKTPGFTVVAVITIAIGIGANTVLFSVFNTVVLRPLDFPQPELLVRAWIDDETGNIAGPAASWPKYEHYRDHAKSFEALAASCFHNATLTTDGDAEQLNGMAVTANFLNVHRLLVARGRDFNAASDVVGGPNEVIITQELWQNRLGGAADIVGTLIDLDGVPNEVIGVLPSGLPFPYQQIQYLLARPDERAGVPLPQVQQGGAIYLQITGRLAPGVARDQADAELHALSAAYNAEHPSRMDANSDHSLRFFADEVVGNLRPTFYLLLSACAFVLLIACANIASLFLGRLSARHKEIAVRLSLGATRRDIIRQFLTESLIFSGFAAVLGVLASMWSLGAVANLASNQLPRADEISFNGTAVGFSVALAVLTALIVALVPAWQASRADLTEALKDTGRAEGGGNAGRRFRAGLIVAEVALSVTLLVGAGLLMTSFWKLLHTDAGFDATGVAAAFVNLPQQRYDTAEKRIAFYEAVSAELTRQPNITHASPVIGLPLSGFAPISPYTLGGQPVMPLPQRPLVGFRVAGPDYRELIGMRLREGRWFNGNDRPNTPPVIVINETFARIVAPGTSAVGKTILTGPNGETVNEIVGVVADIRTNGLNQDAPAEMYFSSTQRANNGMGFAARTTGDPLALQAALRAALKSVDPTIALSFFQTLEQLAHNSLGVQRIAAWLVGCFSGIAFLLAIVGLYSVLAYNVTQRTAEIGIRMALGALPGQIIAMILRQGLALVALGVLTGLAVAGMVAQLIAAQLYGVETLRVAIAAIVAVSFALVAALACFLPARRAAKVDPMIALRSE